MDFSSYITFRNVAIAFFAVVAIIVGAIGANLVWSFYSFMYEERYISFECDYLNDTRDDIQKAYSNRTGFVKESVKQYGWTEEQSRAFLKRHYSIKSVDAYSGVDQQRMREALNLTRQYPGAGHHNTSDEIQVTRDRAFDLGSVIIEDRGDVFYCDRGATGGV